MKFHKICIIGDGLSGLTTALTLQNLSVTIDLFYRNKTFNNFKDKRTTAISDSNYKFLLRHSGEKFRKIINPIKKVSLFYEDNNKFLNFFNFKEENKNMMYIFQNKNLKKLIVSTLKKNKKIKFINKNIKNIDATNCFIQCEKDKKFYDLIILCLGNNSTINNILPPRKIQKSYDEIAFTLLVKSNLDIKNSSQFFLKEGPLAILPYDKNKISIIWSLKKNFFIKNEKKIKNLTIEKLKKIFGKKIKFKISEYQNFPIYLSLRKKYYDKNILFFGGTIHSIHPIAGQGFNLFLRDVKKLRELIQKNLSLGMQLKNSSLLKEFYNSRNPENLLTGLGVDLTNSFFKENKILDPAKKIILEKISNNKILESLGKSLADKGLYF